MKEFLEQQLQALSSSIEQCQKDMMALEEKLEQTKNALLRMQGAQQAFQMALKETGKNDVSADATISDNPAL